MKYCPECRSGLSSGTEKFCPNCGYDINKGIKGTSPGENKHSINIQNTGGNVTGVGVEGSGNVIGNQVTLNRNTYNELAPEFRESLKDFIALINRHGEQLSVGQRKSLEESVNGLAKAAEGLKTGQVVEDRQKRNEIKLQQITLADKIVNYVPKVAETIASATPLAPFSKVIGEGTGYFAEWIKEKLSKK